MRRYSKFMCSCHPGESFVERYSREDRQGRRTKPASSEPTEDDLKRGVQSLGKAQALDWLEISHLTKHRACDRCATSGGCSGTKAHE